MNRLEQCGKVQIKVADFKVLDCRKTLNNFGDCNYNYEGNSLFVRYDNGILEREAKGLLFLAKNADVARGGEYCAPFP